MPISHSVVLLAKYHAALTAAMSQLVPLGCVHGSTPARQVWERRCHGFYVGSCSWQVLLVISVAAALLTAPSSLPDRVLQNPAGEHRAPQDPAGPYR